MPKEEIAETETTDGQSDTETEETQTTQADPEVGEGQSGDLSGTTDTGTQTTEETFFDPKDVPPELESKYKDMLRAFHKKTEFLKAGREKIEAFDAFNQDPVGQLQDMAKRYGYSLTRGQAEQQLQQGEVETDWEPKSWKEVLDRSKSEALQELEAKYQPIMREVQNLRKSNLETYLDNNASDWRLYEDEMMITLKEHPSLVNDPLKLYKLSVPDDVLQSRATQAALKKMQSKTKGALVQGSSTTTRKGPEGIPDKSLTFDEAVQVAQADLARQGITRPGSQ